MTLYPSKLCPRFAKQTLRQRFRELLHPNNEISMKMVVVELFNEILYPPQPHEEEPDPIETEDEEPVVEAAPVRTSCLYSFFLS